MRKSRLAVRPIPYDDKVELEAIRLWRERELGFPEFARRSWAESTPKARDLMRMKAESLLKAQGRMG